MGMILILLIFTLPFGCKQKEEPKQPDDATKETPFPQSKEENSAPSEGLSPDKRVVATVNGRPIYEEDLKGKNLQYVIIDEILYEVALKQGLDKEYEDEVQRYKKNILINAVKRDISTKLPDKKIPTDEEIEEYYKENERKYSSVKAQMIEVNAEDTAEEIQKKAKEGEDIEKIASEYPDSKVLVKSKPINLTIDKNDYFDSLKIGEVSKVVPEKGKFVIYKIVDIKKLPLSQVKPSIAFALVALQRSQAFEELAENLKNEYDIKVEIVKEQE